MNKEQRKALKEALDIIEAVKIEQEEKISSLEENFPNHVQLDNLNDEFERLDTICSELEDLVG